MGKICNPGWLDRTVKVVRAHGAWFLRVSYKEVTDDWGPYATKKEAEEGARGLRHTWKCWAEMKNMPPPDLQLPEPAPPPVKKKLLKRFLKKPSDLEPVALDLSDFEG